MIDSTETELTYRVETDFGDPVWLLVTVPPHYDGAAAGRLGNKKTRWIADHGSSAGLAETAFPTGDRVGARVDLDTMGAAGKSLYVTFGGGSDTSTVRKTKKLLGPRASRSPIEKSL